MRPNEDRSTPRRARPGRCCGACWRRRVAPSWRTHRRGRFRRHDVSVTYVTHIRLGVKTLLHVFPAEREFALGGPAGLYGAPGGHPERQWAHTYQKRVGQRFVDVRFCPCRVLKARECRFRGMVVCAQLIRVDIVFCGCHSGPKVRSIGRLSHVKASLRLRCLHVSRGDRVPPLERC